MSPALHGRAEARILTMNRGSATLKAALYEAGVREQMVLSINIDRAGSSGGGHVTIADSERKPLLDAEVDRSEPDAAWSVAFDWLGKHGHLTELAAAGHRIVHGGAQFREPQRVTPAFLAKLEKLVPLDPDHLLEAISGIRFISQKLPQVPQIVCFDTAFHSGLPTVACMYALPHALYEQGVRRYGFHGLSYEYVVQQLRATEGALAEGRVVIAHLGNGASIVALHKGGSVDTSMGFTPLEGLVMGTRSGDVDPGALLYLLEQRKMSHEELSDQLNRRSGLLGVSGSSEDMRDLLGKSPNDPHAAQAVELFCYRAKKYIGAYAAVLGGIDLLVFTGGIGEHAAPVREKICAGLEFLGIQLDPSRNRSNAPLISRTDALVNVRIIETNEDLMIVRHSLAALGWPRSTDC
ncbi:MAG: acetate/propionate family kinase [Candidatus Acidiferrales bacterium]